MCPVDVPPQARGDRGHLTVVFAAPAVARYLHDHTGVSIKKLVTTLGHYETSSSASADSTSPPSVKSPTTCKDWSTG